jgi:hypothetical protein
MLNLAGGQWHGSRYLGTSGDDSTLRGDDELAWWFVIWSIGFESEGYNTTQEKFKVLPQNSRPGLN